MNTAERLALIRAKAGKQGASLPQPAGIAATKAGTVRTRYRLPKYTRKGYFSHESFAPIRDTRIHAFLYSQPRHEGPIKEEPAFKEGPRHGPHALTKIALQLPAKLEALTEFSDASKGRRSR